MWQKLPDWLLDLLLPFSKAAAVENARRWHKWEEQFKMNCPPPPLVVAGLCDYPASLDKEEQMRKPMAGLWRNQIGTPEGKYLVKRRDGTVVEWPSFVLGAKDPAAPAALRAYAEAARAAGFNKYYCQDIETLALTFENYRKKHGDGDPDRGPHRKDDPKTVAEMKKGTSA